MGHIHGGSATLTGRRLGLAIVITLLFVLAEAVTGYFSHSLALLSDAGHNFADALAAGLLLVRHLDRTKTLNRTAYFWLSQGRDIRGIDQRRVIGRHCVVNLLGSYEPIGRSRAGSKRTDDRRSVNRHHHEHGDHLWLRSASKSDLNVRSAYLHMLGDAISAAGVVLAGLFVAFTGTSIADPVVSVLIAILILWSSWGILRSRSTCSWRRFLKEWIWREVERTIGSVHGVRAVHDLHVWTVGAGMVCSSCHIMVDEQSSPQW